VTSPLLLAASPPIRSSVVGRGSYAGTEFATATGTVAGMNMTGGYEVFGDIPSFSSVEEGDETEAEAYGQFRLIGHCSSVLESHGFWWKYNSDNASRSSFKTDKQAVAETETEQLDPLSLRLAKTFYQNLMIKGATAGGSGTVKVHMPFNSQVLFLNLFRISHLRRIIHHLPIAKRIFSAV
jgi:hypothetical protein